MLQNATIKQKLQAIILVTAASVLLLSLLLFMMAEISSARDETSTRLQTLASVLGANSSAALLFRDNRAASEILATLSSQPDIIWAGIYRASDELFAEYRSAGYSTMDNNESSSAIPLLSDKLEIREPIIFDGRTIGEFHIIGDMSRAHAVLLQQAYLGLGIFTVSMLLAMVLSSRLQRIISEPVRRLLDTMNTVARTRNFGCRAERFDNDELGTLVDGFNSMLEQVESYDRELNTYQQNLEQLVDERTQDLESAKAQAEAANKAKSLFLASISHEIRTPLNGVLGMAQVIHNTPLNEEQKYYIETLDSATRSLLLLIDDLLDLSKIESGKLALEIEPFETFPWITDIQNLTEPLFEHKPVALIIEISNDLPEFLQGDAPRLMQIVVNLITNAAKFTNEGEVKLTIGGEFTEQTVFNLCISVEDTGTGIPNEKLESIFNAFHQIEPSHNTNKGVGLGLAICKHLADIMNGDISVTSRRGQGSCFIFSVSLPVPRYMPQRGENNNHAVIIRPLSILLVDDDSINRMAARTLLEQRGHQVTEAIHGINAIEMLKIQSFDIILMDVHMPVMDGIEATKFIRSTTEPWSQTAIIGLTASVMSDQRDQYIEVGMNAVVEKPVIIEKLLNTIQQLLDPNDDNHNHRVEESR